MHHALYRVALVALLWGATLAGAADPLPALRADDRRTTVSGLSSGGFMAVQYAVAFSASVQGVGVVAGGPYRCAVTVGGDVRGCMTGSPSAVRTWGLAQTYEALDQIDPLEGVARQRIYLYSGTQDKTVSPAVVAAAAGFYRAAGVPPHRLRLDDRVPSGHAFIVPGARNGCGDNQTPYVQQCTVAGKAYDQPREILRHLLGPLQRPAVALSATARPFDQREFASQSSGLGDTGFVYIPAACAADGRGCAVHVVFHGCMQGVGAVGRTVVDGGGFNRWADTNRLIVLYPQVARSSASPFNPKGCWDWWGQLGPYLYTGPAYASRSGLQPSAVRRMVQRLTDG